MKRKIQDRSPRRSLQKKKKSQSLISKRSAYKKKIPKLKSKTNRKYLQK